MGAESPGEKSLRRTAGGGLGCKTRDRSQPDSCSGERVCREPVSDGKFSCDNPEIQRSECWRRAETGRKKGGVGGTSGIFEMERAALLWDGPDTHRPRWAPLFP